MLLVAISHRYGLEALLGSPSFGIVNKSDLQRRSVDETLVVHTSVQKFHLS